MRKVHIDEIIRLMDFGNNNSHFSIALKFTKYYHHDGGSGSVVVPILQVRKLKFQVSCSGHPAIKGQK